MTRRQETQPETRVGHCCGCSSTAALFKLPGNQYRYRCADCFEREVGYRHHLAPARPGTIGVSGVEAAATLQRRHAQAGNTPVSQPGEETVSAAPRLVRSVDEASSQPPRRSNARPRSIYPRARGGVNAVREEFSPGPWQVHETETRTAIKDANGRTVAYVQLGPNQDYDAALIGQAPALLAMCRRYAEECSECAGVGVTIDSGDCEDCRDIREVIALATFQGEVA